MPAHDESSRTELHFESRDGTRLFGTLYETEKASANALVVHGYADHGGRYGEVAQTLNRAGLNALCFDLRGHGRSQGARGYIGDFEQYLEDVEAALSQLQDRCGDNEVLLLGHSNGGLIALHLLANPFRCPERVKAAVISSPFLGLKKREPAKEMFAKVASRLLPKLALPNVIASDSLTHDPEKMREHDNDTLCHDVASARWFAQTTRAQAWVAEFAHRVKVPTLWLVSGLDQLVDPAQTRKVHQRLTSESSYHEFADMHHEVFNELDRAKVFQLLSEFCTDKFSSVSP